MICENINSKIDYSFINPNFKKAFQFLRDHDLKTLSIGKHEIDGDKVFATVQEYITKAEEEANWESHEKYIDIQFIVEGQEIMGYTRVNNLEIKKDYRPEKDLIFYNSTNLGSNIKYTSGDYAVYFPEDAHRPGCVLDKPSKVRKIVIKIACNCLDD